MRIPPVILVAACTASLAWLQPPGGGAAAAPAAARQSPARPTVFVDACVTDDSARPVTTLGTQDVRVTIDGEPRPVVSLRYVFRGPGADAAAALADPAREAPAAAERSRTLLLLVDETSFPRGQEKLVAGAVGRFLDELGSADQAAVAPLPTPPGVIQLTSNQAVHQASLSRVSGRAASETAQDVTAVQPNKVSDPDEQARRGEAEREASLLERRGQADGTLAAERGPDAARARSTTKALLSIVDGLRSLTGLKTVIVFKQADSGRDWPTTAPAPDRQADVAALSAAAARARAAIHLVVVGPVGKWRNPADDDLRAVASASGGTVTAARNAGDSKPFDALRAALWGGYLIEFEGRESDPGNQPHRVTVESSRGRTTVRAPRLWVPRSDPVPPTIARTAEAAPPPGAAASPGVKPPRRPKALDPALVLLLSRMQEYLAAYVRDFGNVVAEEDYNQRMVRGTPGEPPLRHLRSDLLLVKTDGEVGWTQYRDVFEVDGKRVRDREARVQKLFLENPAGARRLAQEISNESARYNIGTLTRTINLPTLPLALLGPNRIGGLAFEREGEDTVGGIKAARVTFEELARPTLVRPINMSGDAPSRGTLWIDPSNGRIVRTRISVAAGRSEMTTTVTYRPAPETGLWMPAEMEETCRKPGEEIEGRATYRNFRSFKVTTDTQIK